MQIEEVCMAGSMFWVSFVWTVFDTGIGHLSQFGIDDFFEKGAKVIKVAKCLSQ